MLKIAHKVIHIVQDKAVWYFFRLIFLPSFLWVLCYFRLRLAEDEQKEVSDFRAIPLKYNCLSQYSPNEHNSCQWEVALATNLSQKITIHVVEGDDRQLPDKDSKSIKTFQLLKLKGNFMYQESTDIRENTDLLNMKGFRNLKKMQN